MFAGNFQPVDCFGNCAGIGRRIEPEVEFQQFSHLLQSEWRLRIIEIIKNLGDSFINVPSRPFINVAILQFLNPRRTPR